MATKIIAWNTGTGNITLTYQGQGDGPVTVQSDANGGDARSQVITIETTAGSPVVTKNLTIRQGACPIPIGTVLNYAYTGSYQEVELPAGQYKLQCWGAQGGSNAAYSTYGITAKSGGKGGYSEGVLTLSSPTTVYIFVGGQGGSSGNGGWNGGGGGNGTTQYNASNTLGYTKVGCGGGATDIALVTSEMSYSSYRTNRSAASLLSRIIVAGGGSGGAMSYTAVTTSSTESQTINSYTEVPYSIDGSTGKWTYVGYRWDVALIDVSSYKSWSSAIYRNSNGNNTFYTFLTAYPTENQAVSYCSGWSLKTLSSSSATETVPSTAQYMVVGYRKDAEDISTNYRYPRQIVFSHTVSTTTTSNNSSTGKVGGGTSGGGSYPGTQSAAGDSNAGFGYGTNQQATGNRYHAGLGGGGWYGGGSKTSDSSPSSYMGYSGGGSGFVNVAASAGNRPSGYTGLELDSGTTYDGNSSFPSTSGGTETGHSGNGYARITRIS